MTRKELIKKLKPYWKKIMDLNFQYMNDIIALEDKMQKEFEIEDLEIFHCDGEPVGIGNYERTIKLIHAFEIEKEK